MPNILTNPEEFGLVKVGNTDLADTPGQFDLAAVWRDNSGDYLWGYDTGFYGLDEPFEDYEVDDLARGSKQEALAALREEAEDARDFVKDGQALNERVDALVKTIEATGDQFTSTETF